MLPVLVCEDQQQPSAWFLDRDAALDTLLRWFIQWELQFTSAGAFTCGCELDRSWCLRDDMCCGLYCACLLFTRTLLALVVGRRMRAVLVGNVVSNPSMLVAMGFAYPKQWKKRSVRAFLALLQRTPSLR
jgi:hypothetical protein